MIGVEIFGSKVLQKVVITTRERRDAAPPNCMQLMPANEIHGCGGPGGKTSWHRNSLPSVDR